jgi:hypothetical protein
MKNTFKIIGIAAIFLAFLVPQLSFGQVKITMKGDIIEITAKSPIRYMAYYTKEGFQDKIDFSTYNEQPYSQGIPIGDLRGKHNHITVFAIDENGDVDSKIYSLTGNAYPVKSTLTGKMRKDGVFEINAPDHLMYQANFTKEGYWGINRYSYNDSDLGIAFGGLTSGKYPFITVAAIDREGNVFAKKINLTKKQNATTAEDFYNFKKGLLILNVNQNLPVSHDNYICYTKKFSLDKRGDITATIQVIEDKNYYTIELVTWGNDNLVGKGGLGYMMSIMPYSSDWNMRKNTQAIYATGYGFQKALKDLETKLNGVDGKIVITGKGDPTKGKAVITFERK